MIEMANSSHLHVRGAPPQFLPHQCLWKAARFKRNPYLDVKKTKNPHLFLEALWLLTVIENNAFKRLVKNINPYEHSGSRIYILDLQWSKVDESAQSARNVKLSRLSRFPIYLSGKHISLKTGWVTKRQTWRQQPQFKLLLGEILIPASIQCPTREHALCLQTPGISISQ